MRSGIEVEVEEVIGAGFAAGTGSSVREIPVVREERAVAGREVMIIHAPRHAGRFVHLRIAPDRLAIGSVFLEEVAGTPRLDGSLRVGEPAVEVAGFGGVTGAV